MSGEGCASFHWIRNLLGLTSKFALISWDAACGSIQQLVPLDCRTTSILCTMGVNSSLQCRTPSLTSCCWEPWAQGKAASSALWAPTCKGAWSGEQENSFPCCSGTSGTRNIALQNQLLSKPSLPSFLIPPVPVHPWGVDATNISWVRPTGVR